MSNPIDVAVVGSGPNGLAAAITVARAGKRVRVYEAEDTIGGGARSGELIEPGFIHDLCSAVHPFGAASPFFRELPLHEYGLDWVHPDLPLAHPLDDGTAGALRRSLAATARGFGQDGRAYWRLMQPFVREFDALAGSVLAPIVRPPRHPLLLARFGLQALRSGEGLANARFETDAAQALFAGMAAHSALPLRRPLTASFGLVLGAAAHAVGWPLARGGSQAITDAMAAYLHALGGEVVTGHRVATLGDLPPAAATIFDVTPQQLLHITRDKMSGRYRRQLLAFRYGAGVFKLDYTLDAPVPWTAEPCRAAGTVHVVGGLPQLLESEDAVAHGRLADRPYVITSQPSLFDPTRAPAGKHTFWAYCHVPNGSAEDATSHIETQIERFAPGFRDIVRGRRVTTPATLQEHNANYIGGDIAGGRTAGCSSSFAPRCA